MSGETVPEWLLQLTFCIEYSPNCNMRWLVRLVGYGRGKIDRKSLGETKDACGCANTIEEAAAKALTEKVKQQQCVNSAT
jgi:hypothetical protein